MAANIQEKKAPVEEKKITHVTVRDEYGNPYRLEFNSATVKAMESKGFKVDLDFPNTMIEELWAGAFQMHHPKITKDRVKAIWKIQKGKQELLGILAGLYARPLEELLSEPKESENDDPTWETD